jgi:Uma2 family endonuclease
MTALPLRQEIFYPESDGEPMAETEWHLDETIYLIDALKERFREAPDVYVGGDMFLYYEEGRPRSVVSPDVFVVRGVEKKRRGTYKTWEEGGRVPCLVVEVTSDSTQNEDFTRKKELYQRLGVEEYLLYDPLGDYLDPRIQGFRLVRGRYVSLPPEPDGSVISRTTGVTLRMEGTQIRLLETATGQALSRYQEAQARRRELEDENVRLRAELEQLRKARS